MSLLARILEGGLNEQPEDHIIASRLLVFAVK